MPRCGHRRVESSDSESPPLPLVSTSTNTKNYLIHKLITFLKVKDRQDCTFNDRQDCTFISKKKTGSLKEHQKEAPNAEIRGLLASDERQRKLGSACSEKSHLLINCQKYMKMTSHRREDVFKQNSHCLSRICEQHRIGDGPKKRQCRSGSSHHLTLCKKALNANTKSWDPPGDLLTGSRCLAVKGGNRNPCDTLLEQVELSVLKEPNHWG